jgi:hypothetical protein
MVHLLWSGREERGGGMPSLLTSTERCHRSTGDATERRRVEQMGREEDTDRWDRAPRERERESESAAAARERAYVERGLMNGASQFFSKSNIVSPWVQLVKWQNYLSRTPQITNIFGVVE